MSVKGYLKACRDEQKELIILQEKSEWLRASLIPGAQKLREVIVQTSTGGDKMGDTVADIVELDKKIQAQMVRIAQRQSAAIDIISHMPESLHRQVLTLYYLPNGRPLTIKEVADKIGYSPARARKIRDKALDEAELFGEKKE